MTEFNAGEVDGIGGTLTSTTAASSTSTCSSRSRCTVAPPTSSALTWTRRRARLRPHRQAHAADTGEAERSRSATRPTCPPQGRPVTHFEAEILTENIARYLADEELDAGYDGHANCFIETGFHRALLIDFNYETEPLPRPLPHRVRLPLLRESRLNHLGKLAFQWVYWHALLPGREIPASALQCRPPARSEPQSTPERRTR